MKLALSLSCVALLATMACDNKKNLSGSSPTAHIDEEATTPVNTGEKDGSVIGPNGEIIAPSNGRIVSGDNAIAPEFSEAAGEGINADVTEESVTAAEQESEGNGGILDVLEADTAVGLKTGTQILNTFYTITGVQQPNDTIETAYLEFKQSLPSSYKLQSFDAGQQAALVKLALEFCNIAFDDANLAQQMVPGLNMNKAPSAFGAADKATLAQGLAMSVWGPVDTGVPQAQKEQPLIDLTTGLIDGLTDKNSVQNTINVVKGVCGATLASLQTILL